MFRRTGKNSPVHDEESGFSSPDLERVELNDERSSNVKKTAKFEDQRTPKINVDISSKTPLLCHEDVDNELGSPESQISTPSSRTSRILGTAEQVSRMQTQSIYRFLNPSSEAVARDVSLDRILYFFLTFGSDEKRNAI